MSFHDITPNALRRRLGEYVKIGIGIDNRRRRSQCVISISRGIAERAGLRYGMAVTFLLGDDKDRGKLKLRHSTDETRRYYARKLIWHSGGSRSRNRLRATLEAWDGCPASLTATVCKYEVGEGEITITLPEAFSQQRQAAKRLEPA